MKTKLLLFTFFLCAEIVPCKAQFFSKITGNPFSSNLRDSRSVNWIDVNNDNRLDCFISNGPSGGQNNSLFINSGSTFSLVTNDSIVLDNAPSDGATFGDINNDGAIDAFVVNWYNVNNLFFLNDGTGSFTKINSEIISNDQGYSETASWGDYDKDGLLDLYVTNSAGSKKNYLYHNDGFTQFSKITTGPPVNDQNYSRNVNWTDIDNDGDLDLFVTNENNQNENLYLNANGNFTKHSTGLLLTDGGNTNSSSWGDIDNDGDLDVFLANDLGFNSLFRNDGNLTFTKLSSDTVCKTPSRSFSSAWSDIDNDGDLDLFVTNSFGTAHKLLNYLYINQGNGSFLRNTSDVVTQDSAFSYGCAFGDYDNDGFEDLAVATCRFGGLDQGDFLYHNTGNSNNWITFTLKGSISNKSAIGAKVRIKAVINGTPVWQMREISSQSSYCGQNDLRVHFGLGAASIIDSVSIEWPLGLKEHYTNLAVNQFVTYTENPDRVGLIHSDYNSPDILVYPNPTQTHITIKSGNVKFLQKGTLVTLQSMTGAVILTQLIEKEANEMQLDLKNKTISSGNYIIRFDLKEGGTIVKKIVFQ